MEAIIAEAKIWLGIFAFLGVVTGALYYPVLRQRLGKQPEAANRSEA